MSNTTFNQIAEVFRTIQVNSATHLKNVQKLKAIYLNESHSNFMESFEKCLHVALKVDYKQVHPFANRIVAFISSFAVTMQDYHLKNVDSESDSTLVTATLAFLMRMSHTASENIRCRSCEFISKIFSALTGYDLTIELCDGVQESMLSSLEDKVALTRMLAASALAPLQSMENTHCPIVQAFLDHMESDSSAKVRKICVEKIGLKKDVIPHLIEASRDLDINVKLAVFKRALKYPHSFKIIHKQQLIINGFMDELDAVKTFVAKQMIPAWLQYYEVNYIKLLSGLRLDSTWSDLEITIEVAEYALSTLFNLRPENELIEVLKLNEKKLLDLQQLNWDTIVYWRFLIEHLRKRDAADTYAPNIPDLHDYIIEYCVYSMQKIESNKDIYSAHEFQFILLQLFYIAKGYNYVDTSCKQHMQDLIKHVLKTYNLDLEVINVIILTLNYALPNISEQSKFICDIAGDLLYSNEAKISETQSIIEKEPTAAHVEESTNEAENLNSTQDNYAIAQLKVKYFTISEQLDIAVKNQDYLKASELKPLVDDLSMQLNAIKAKSTSEVIPDSVMEEEPAETEDTPEKVTDPAIIKKVLLMTAGYLTSSKIKTLNNTLKVFKANVIDEFVHSDNMQIKIAAMRCLSLCCTIDEHTAKMALNTFCAIIMSYNHMSQHPPPVELVIISIGVVVDSILLFGTKIFANPPDNSLLSVTVDEEQQDVFTGGISLSTVIRELLELLNDENVRIQKLSGRGICYFITTSRICSYAVISRLVLKYVSPTTNDLNSIKLQQYIGVTLSKLPQIPNSAPQLEKAILPTIKIILKAPQSNPLSNVDIDNLAKLLLDLAKAYEVEGETMHKNILQQLLKELHERPHNHNNLVYTKILFLCHLPQNDKEFLTKIIEMVDELRDRICDSKVMANLIKFNTKVNLMMENIADENALPNPEE